jgi:5'-nucleotidase
MLILVTNDDGIESPGIHAIARELTRLGRVVMVAPKNVKSAVSHSITLHRPLRAFMMKRDGILCHIVDGTPADCVKLALHELLRKKPDIVVSGINIGLNTGHNVLYSGTVAGALEASMHGLTSFAVSLQVSKNMDFAGAARRVRPIVHKIVREYPKTRTVFNINVPAGRVKGVRVCVHETEPHHDQYERRIDPRGQVYYWLKPERLGNGTSNQGSDAGAVSRGFISVSPLIRSLTHESTIEGLRRLLSGR